MAIEKELKNFFTICLLRPKQDCIRYVIKRVSYKVLRRFYDLYCWYPEEVKEAVRALPKNPRQQWTLPVLPHAQNCPAVPAPPLRLASQTLPPSDDFPWDQHFDDYEDFESLHRWNWLLDSLSRCSPDKQQGLHLWGEKALLDWMKKKFQKENIYIWAPYTTGERICNAVLFYFIVGCEPPREVAEGIKEFVSHLVDTLEYNGDYTGNHIFNNGRALFLAGRAFGVKEWSSLGELIISQEAVRLMTEDGFLNDGSIHYHFLFTRWVLEILFFAQITEAVEMQALLKEKANTLLERCHFFLVHNERKDEWNMPLIGDISPDCSPQWLLSLTGKSTARNLLNDKSRGSWENLFRGKPDIVLKKIPKGVRTNLSLFPASGWYRGDYHDVSIIWRAEQGGSPGHASHAHCDLGSFCLFLKGVPFLVDLGRLNYTDSYGNFGVGSKAHNTICIDELGPFPEQWLKFPESYSRGNVDVVAQRSDSGIQIEMKFDGFKRLKHGVIVLRKIWIRKRAIIVEDSLTGRGIHRASLYFHFSPEISTFEKKQQALAVQGDFGSVDISFQNNKGDAHVEYFFGGDDPLGWFVEEYGQKQPSLSVKIDKKYKDTLFFKTQMVW